MSRASDWALVDAIAAHLAPSLRGSWAERIDALDQRYWDLTCDDGTLTLHLEHYLGISLYDVDFVAHGARPSPLLVRAFAVLSAFEPRW